MSTHEALIIVDVQYDFLPGGALAVPHADEVVPVISALLRRFDLAVATQDWHPPEHASFASQHPGKRPGDLIVLDGLDQVLWPDHCVQGSRGAELVAELDATRFARVFRKGEDPRVDSYSGFFDNAERHATGLEAFLRERGVTSVVVAGLATDYCVAWTAQDARRLGFDTTLVLDGCRGVELQPGDVDRALARLRQAGVRVATGAEVLR